MQEHTLPHFVAAVFEVSLVTASFEQVRNYARRKVETLSQKKIARLNTIELQGQDGVRLAALVDDLNRLFSKMVRRQDFAHKIAGAGSLMAGTACLCLLYMDWVSRVGLWCGVLLLPAIFMYGADGWAYWRFSKRSDSRISTIDYLLNAYSSSAESDRARELKKSIESFREKISKTENGERHP